MSFGPSVLSLYLHTPSSCTFSNRPSVLSVRSGRTGSSTILVCFLFFLRLCGSLLPTLLVLMFVVLLVFVFFAFQNAITESSHAIYARGVVLQHCLW